MNYLTKPFDNIHIREAFALAIDKSAIVQKVWQNTLLATNHIVPQGPSGYNTELKGPDGTQALTGNQAQAKLLLQQGLKEEGWTSASQIPAITLTYASGFTLLDQEVQALIQQWQTTLGITVISDTVGYQTLLDKVTASTLNEHGLQLWGLAWIGEYPDAQDWLSLQFGAGSAYNNSNYGQNQSSVATQQQTTQQMLTDADSNVQNAAARLQSYHQAEQQLVNDVAWLPIEQATNNFLRDTAIVGITDNAQGTIPPDDWSSIYRVQ
jgi:peptide/nickel transport system substrate-binding protein/oligopeptide transport system substrate-binding protein